MWCWTRKMLPWSGGNPRDKPRRFYFPSEPSEGHLQRHWKVTLNIARMGHHNWATVAGPNSQHPGSRVSVFNPRKSRSWQAGHSFSWPNNLRNFNNSSPFGNVPSRPRRGLRHYVMVTAFSECCIESNIGGWISMFFCHSSCDDRCRR